jgi:large conductance mechanosensitive channel
MRKYDAKIAGREGENRHRDPGEERSMLKGFRDFIARGNVIDLAVGVIIGAAFGAIVDSLVKDMITPIIGLLGGQPDFSALKVGPIGIGNFINAVIAFLIKAAGLYFLIVLPFNKVAARMAAAAPPSPQEVLLTEIRDLLKNRPAAV